MSEPESFRERMARLRREKPAAERELAGAALAPDAATPPPSAQGEVGEQAASGAGLPSWMKARLAARRRPRAKERGKSGPEPSSELSVGEPGRLQRVENLHGPYALRETPHSQDHVHGSWKLAAVDAASSADIALLTGDSSLAGLDLRRAIYLDVETTGLSGGAGTTSFMVALGRFEGSQFKLWQGFLEGPEQERAMLWEVAERVRAADCVVSFFGKSFDRHRLEDKMRLHHIAPPFEGRPHLDLYHPLNRMYKRSVPNGRLCTMEQTLCDVRRLDDLPGSYAPEAWFDYLGQRAHRLEAVFQHNADDVLSLVTLAAHLGRTRLETTANGEQLSGSPAARALAWAQLHGKRNQPAAALDWLSLALERAPALLSERALGFESGIWNRQLGHTEAALALFEGLAQEHSDELAARALVEVAKLQEHALGKAAGWQLALGAAEQAKQLAAGLFGGKGLRLERELEHRLARLRTKLDGSKV